MQDPDAPPATDHFAAPMGEAVSPQTAPESASEGASKVEAGAPDTTEVAPEVSMGLEAFCFSATFDQVFSCPAGHAPKEQSLTEAWLKAVFSSEHCSGCPLAGRCPTRRLSGGDRKFRRVPAAIVTQVRQYEQRQPAFKEQYRRRSGIESTNEEIKGRHGLGNLRIRGKPRVELAVWLKSLALNIKRAMQWHVLQTAECASCPC